MSTDYSADSTLILFSPPAAILSSAVFQISSGIRGRPAENGSGSNRMEKVPSSKSRRSAKVQIEGAINHSKLTYLALAGLTNTVVKGKNNISAIYSLVIHKISMRFYHIEWFKVKEIEILLRFRFSLFNMAATKF